MKWSMVRGPGRLPVLALLSAALLVGACGDDGTDPIEADPTTINVIVRADGATRQGVTAHLFTSGSQTALATKQTAANGIASFGDLAEPGAYEAEIDVPAGLLVPQGEVTRKSVTVVEGDTAVVAFDLVTDSDGGDVVEIHLTSSNQFDPSSVTISPGTTVRWINDIARFHTITPSGHSEWQRQEMNSDGQIFEHTFQAAGTFDYFCEPHESLGMTGSITVQ